MLQVSCSVRSPTIACTPSEASCTGEESVSCWTTSTSSSGEQSYATQSLPTAWLYTLVRLVEFAQLKKSISVWISVKFLCLRDSELKDDTVFVQKIGPCHRLTGLLGLNMTLRQTSPDMWHSSPQRCVITEIKLWENVFVLEPPILISPSAVASTCFNDKFYYGEYIILLIMDST